VIDISRERLRRLAAAILAAVLVAASGWLFWDISERRAAERAGNEAVQAARDAIVAILSYQPATAERDLGAAARDRLTGKFLEDYTQVITTVVVPNATQQDITAAAQVPAVAVVSAHSDRVVVLAYVDQTTTVGKQAPLQAKSSVRVSMERVDGRWLIAGFEPI
jgi:Mce-associated membrane protein